MLHQATLKVARLSIYVGAEARRLRLASRSFPAGAVVVFVSLPEQVVYVYRNGVRIGRSTVSTGKAGKATPTGVFTVLQKKVDHESTIYKGAKMPTCSG